MEEAEEDYKFIVRPGEEITSSHVPPIMAEVGEVYSYNMENWEHFDSAAYDDIRYFEEDGYITMIMLKGEDYYEEYHYLNGMLRFVLLKQSDTARDGIRLHFYNGQLVKALDFEKNEYTLAYDDAFFLDMGIFGLIGESLYADGMDYMEEYYSDMLKF